MRKSKAIALTMALAGLLTSCDGRYAQQGDFYYLRNDGAVMPVWVMGNVDSGVFLITIHGGPGDSGWEFALSDGFQQLEEDYAIVYWDQRFAGLSQGDPDRSTMTIEQHVEDTDQVVALIEHLYAPESMFMVGHSWGGGLGTAYLGRGSHQDAFDGWINIDGSMVDSIETEAVRRWTLEKVDERIAMGDDPAYWQYIVDWYAEHPEVVYCDWPPGTYGSMLGNDIYDIDQHFATVNTPTVELAFRSPFSFSFQHDYSDCEWLNGFDLTPEIEAITIPTFFVWGEEDGIQPVELTDYHMAHSGAPDADKWLVTYPECAHSPHYEVPDDFVNDVQRFVESYRRN